MRGILHPGALVGCLVAPAAIAAGYAVVHVPGASVLVTILSVVTVAALALRFSLTRPFLQESSGRADGLLRFGYVLLILGLVAYHLSFNHLHDTTHKKFAAGL